MAGTRPFEDDLSVAAGQLALHTNAASVWFYRLCQWRMRDPGALLEFKDNQRQFLAETFALAADEKIVKDFNAAMLQTPLAERGEWASPEPEFLRQTYARVQAVIWFAISAAGGGNLDLEVVAEKYGIDKSNISRAITNFRKKLAGPDLEEDTDIPQPLDFESPLAVDFYGAKAVAYHLTAKRRYDAANFDLDHPLVASLVHQIIVNSYRIQRLQKSSDKDTKDLGDFARLMKQITELQDSNEKLHNQLINVQKAMGKMESSAESLDAVKKRLEEVRKTRDPGAEDVGVGAVAAANLENNKYLGIGGDGGVD